MDAVKTSPSPNVTEWLSALEGAGRTQGFRVEEMGRVGSFPLLAMTKRTAGVRPRIYLSAGSHGDEPAGPATLLALLQSGFFDHRATWFICPLLNPIGLAQGTRENAEGIDLNRDYKGIPKSAEIRAHLQWLHCQPRFDLHLCLHEDWESTGFYLYEINPDQLRSHAAEVIEAVRKICPIEMAELVDGRPNQAGIMRPVINLLDLELWPESAYLRSEHSRLGYTTETPSSLPLEQRVAVQRLAVSTIIAGAVEEFTFKSRSDPKSDV